MDTTLDSSATQHETSANTGLHRTIWRWHFYAGLFCTPFVIWLSITGTIYLFKPQFENWRDQPYSHLLIDGPRAGAQAQVDAALAAVPGARFKAYELAPTPDGAARIVLRGKAGETLVYVHPQNLQILKVQNSDERLMQVVHELHGTLLLGDRGSILIELAASWAVVMIVTGLYLWWPCNAQGLAGVVYPRLHLGGRQFWRDLHSVIGLWVSAFALFLLISALPWTKIWGDSFKNLRQLGSSTVVQQDWTTGGAKKIAPTALASDEHAGHEAHHHHAATSDAAPAGQYAVLDPMIAAVAPLNLAAPVRINAPTEKSPRWTAQSLAQDRTQRVDLVLDEASGAVIERKNFSDRKLLDRIVGIGIAVHEGQMFGWFNQLLGMLTALGLSTLGVSAYVMWWKRRPTGLLGAPRFLANSRVPPALWLLAITFGVLLPLLGLSMIAVLLTEHLLLRRLPRASHFLGLRPV